MRYIKPFLVTFSACVLICSIPISSCADFVGAVSPYDEQLMRFTYNGANKDASTSPWYHLKVKGYADNPDIIHELAGRIHCRGGHVYKAFLLWIPFYGYYLVVIQDGELPSDLGWASDPSRHAIYVNYGEYFNPTANTTNPAYFQYYAQYYGDGTISSSSNRSLFQTVLFSYYVVFYRIHTDNTSSQEKPNKGTQYSVSNYGLPTPDEEDELLNFIEDGPFPNLNGKTPIVLDGQDSESETYPDGTPVPTNSAGNPVPTNEFGQTVPTLPNGKSVPLYPDGTPAEYYTDASGVYHTVPYTIYDNSSNESDVRDHFSRFNDMISDLDGLSSIMESNASDLSVHVDGTRGLVDDVLSWFPAPVIAIMVCGVIMIIAVKITGSGKS